jgi:hypothetical protein
MLKHNIYFEINKKFDNIIFRLITKLPNSEQSYKGKVQTHNYINRQNQSTTGKLWKRELCYWRYYKEILPTLFSVLMNDLVNMLSEHNLGVNLASDIINCLLFADDIVLMGKLEQELQTLLNITFSFMNVSIW